MEGSIETRKLPNDIANMIQAWMYDMQSEYKTGTYYLDAGYLGTISIHIKNQETLYTDLNGWITRNKRSEGGKENAS